MVICNPICSVLTGSGTTSVRNVSTLSRTSPSVAILKSSEFFFKRVNFLYHLCSSKELCNSPSTRSSVLSDRLIASDTGSTSPSFANSPRSYFQSSTLLILLFSYHLVSISFKQLTISLPLKTAYVSSLGAASILCLLSTSISEQT